MNPVVNSPATSTSVAAAARPRSPRSTLPRINTFPSRPAWIAGAPAARAASGIMTGDSSCHVTGNPSRSSASIAADSPTTMATASPRNRASVSAKTGWSAVEGITPNRLRPGTSAEVNTATTPGISAA